MSFKTISERFLFWGGGEEGDGDGGEFKVTKLEMLSIIFFLNLWFWELFFFFLKDLCTKGVFRLTKFSLFCSFF